MIGQNKFTHVHICTVSKKKKKTAAETRFLKKSSKYKDGWMKALADRARRAHSITSCYISHNHPYTSSSDILAGTIYSLHPAIPTLATFLLKILKISMVAEKGHPHPLSAHVKPPAVVLLTARGN